MLEELKQKVMKMFDELGREIYSDTLGRVELNNSGAFLLTYINVSIFSA